MANRKADSHGSIHRTGWMHYPVYPTIPVSRCTSGHICTVHQVKTLVSNLAFLQRKSWAYKQGTFLQVSSPTVGENKHYNVGICSRAQLEPFYPKFYYYYMYFLQAKHQKCQETISTQPLENAVFCNMLHVFQRKDSRRSASVPVSCPSGCSVPQVAVILQILYGKLTGQQT